MLNKSKASLPRMLALAAVCAGALLHANAQAQATGRIGFIYTERLMTESRLAKVAD
jgi:outer membrane protein